MKKRIFDLVVLTLALILLFPGIVFIAIVVKLNLGSPIFFKQNRPGMYGLSFKVVKFRSMTTANDLSGCILPDAERLTSFGRLLRSSSLDELPGLWNVLRGEMSIVGPRPLLVEYLPLYTPEQARRHEMRPGITGWAQVNGRNALSWEEKFALDVWYVDNQSLWLDVKILVMTVIKVMKREGISAAGETTMPRFTGSAKR